jgi:hypothetical protein
MKRLFNFVTLEQRWMLLLWVIPLLLVILPLVWVLFSVPENASLRVEKIGSIWLLASFLLVILPGVIAGVYYWRSYYHARGQLSAALGQVSDLEQSNAELLEQLSDALDRASSLEQLNDALEEKLNVITEQTGLSIRLYSEGFSDIDYDLVERLFRDCQKAWLHPLPGGFSGSLVFRVDSWDRQGVPQQPMVLKLGLHRKIKAEERNYRRFVQRPIGSTGVLMGDEYEGERGAILFTYARMSRGKALTFEEFYSDAGRNTADNVAAVIGEVFQNALQPWLEGSRPNTHSRLYQTYSLVEDWNKICQAVSDLGFALGADYFDCLERRFPNPLKETQEWFEVRRDRECITRDAIIHGDLNSRNILIDSNRNVFIIDFAKTRWSHLLRDFCKLEAEIKFCLTRLYHNEDIEQAVALETELLLATNEEPFETLESLLNVNPVENTNPHLERARRSVVALRQIASHAMGLQVTEPAEQYYLGLLHYTLDTLRYAQCDPNSKLHALISASLLCRALR